LGVNVNEFPQPSPILKFHNTRYFGKQCIVGSNAYVQAWFELGTALPHDDGPAVHYLAGEAFHSKPLGLAISPIPGASYTFFVCHADPS